MKGAKFVSVCISNYLLALNSPILNQLLVRFRKGNQGKSFERSENMQILKNTNTFTYSRERCMKNDACTFSIRVGEGRRFTEKKKPERVSIRLM